jgi:hypothetical protein
MTLEVNRITNGRRRWIVSPEEAKSILFGIIAIRAIPGQVAPIVRFLFRASRGDIWLS